MNVQFKESVYQVQKLAEGKYIIRVIRDNEQYLWEGRVNDNGEVILDVVHEGEGKMKESVKETIVWATNLDKKGLLS